MKYFILLFLLLTCLICSSVEQQFCGGYNSQGVCIAPLPCNKTLCDGISTYYSACYCYFGEKTIRTENGGGGVWWHRPHRKNCSDLLREIGDHNGLYHCSSVSCNCDQYGDCVCKPPKNKNPQISKTKQCDSKQCEKRSFEYCQCSRENCS